MRVQRCSCCSLVLNHSTMMFIGFRNTKTKHKKNVLRLLIFQILRSRSCDGGLPKHDFGARPTSFRIFWTLSADRGAQTWNTRAGGQDDSSSEQTPSNYGIEDLRIMQIGVIWDHKKSGRNAK